jgi:prepilin-type N-terminal cleavage/methylation domain-containing protein
MPRQNTTKGFQLIELIIVIIILSVIMGGTVELLAQGFRAYFAEQNLITADWQGYLAIERMERDLHSIRSKNDIILATSSVFSFIDINGNTITYQLAGNQLKCNVQVGGVNNNQTLADGIQSLSFQYYDSSSISLGSVPSSPNLIRYVVITLNITYGNANFNLTTGIHPWNLF